jgi:4'-phosphopantetheinyl transferase
VAELAFNVSHSGDLALYAFTSGRAVGVDVELIGRRRPDVLALAERAFGQEEAARLGRIAASMREHEFLRSWVRHEAALKCRGGRLGEDVAYDGLTLRELDIGPAAVAALAVEGPVREVRLSDLPAGWFGPKISDGESRPGGGRDSPKLSEP